MLDDPLYASAWPIVQFETLDSTNSQARRQAEFGDIGPSWILTASQTAGRGRMGRTWKAAPGNVFTTALFELKLPVARAPEICFLAGLALVEAVSSVAPGCGDKVSLKWPNDVLCDSAKLSGILIETGLSEGRLWVAAGFGVNLVHAPEGVGQDTISLMDISGGVEVSPAKFVSALDVTFRRWLGVWHRMGFESVRETWLKRAAHLNQLVGVNVDDTRVEGEMMGLGDDGALLLKLAGGEVRAIRAGDVSVLG